MHTLTTFAVTMLALACQAHAFIDVGSLINDDLDSEEDAGEGSNVRVGDDDDDFDFTNNFSDGLDTADSIVSLVWKVYVYVAVGVVVCCIGVPLFIFFCICRADQNGRNQRQQNIQRQRQQQAGIGYVQHVNVVTHQAPSTYNPMAAAPPGGVHTVDKGAVPPPYSEGPV